MNQVCPTFQDYRIRDLHLGPQVSSQKGECELSNSKETMRRDWDERARRNAFLYIASWRKDWNEDVLFRVW